MTDLSQQRENLDASTAEDFSLPLTEAQKEMWLAARMSEAASRAHNNTFVIHLRGDLRVHALLQCLQELVDRHDALRTSFDLSEPKQYVAASSRIQVPIVDLTQKAQPEKAELATAIQSESGQAFDVTMSPLLRARLVKLSASHHVLLLTSNHLVADNWSLGVLLDELKELYAGRGQDISGRLAPAMQFREYVRLLNEPAQREFMSVGEAYWLQQFAEPPTPTDLPSDFRRPVMRTYQAGEESGWLGPDLSQMMRKASAKQQCSLETFLLAVFKVLVNRLTGQEDLVVAIPAAGQTAAWLKQENGSGGLVGHCVNFLPVRSYCRTHLTFSDYLKTLETVVLDGCKHQNFTYGSLLAKMTLPRDPGRPPLVSLVFYLDQAATGFSLHGLDTEVQEVPRRTALFDLELKVTEFDQDLKIACTFNSDLFTAQTIQRWLSHYRTLLADVLANPGKRLFELALLTTEERRQLLLEWNGTEREYPRDSDLHILFENQVDRTPDAVAVEFEGKTLAYSDLNRRANQLAHWLKKLGVGPDVLVGLYMERSLETMVAMLGVLKAGGAYVPLDTAYPKDRLAFMLTDANPRVVITQQRLRNRIPDQEWSIVCLDSESEAVSVQPSENLSSEKVPESLAYVIYTSGSTGRPKGVAMTREALLNLIIWQRGVSNSKESGRTLQFSSLSFDVSFQEIFSTWCTGGTLVLIQEQVRRDSRALVHFLQSNRVSRLFLPFIALEQLAEAAVSLRALPSTLKEVYTAGEQLIITPKILGLFEKLPGCSLHNQYGPSESHVVTAYTLPALKSQWQPRPPIGTPIANCQVYVLDDQLRPVPVGVAGELYIGGSCLARGYVDRPEVTAEKFIPNPFRTGRLYKTGDLVRYLRDGKIEFLGRSDHQVKLRGFRIELGEIESVLAQQPRVGEAVVVVREEVPGDQRLVAYVVSHGEPSEAGERELRRSLSERLPEYMLPSAYVFLDALPLTPSGKVDRRGLPAVSGAQSGSSERYVGPRDEIERKLTKMWQELLRVSRIGINDSFFDLGGHSLHAIRLIARVEEELGKTFSLATLFQSPTIEGLAQELKKKRRLPGLPLLVPFRTGGTQTPLFLHGGSLELSRHLGDRPCYGLEPHGQDGTRAPETVQEMAADYLRQMRSVHPQGDYFVGGFSFGGLVAFEMAQQLRQSGQQVGLLILIDPSPPNFSNAATREVSSGSSGSADRGVLGRHWKKLKEEGPSEYLSYLLASIKDKRQRLARTLKMLLCCAYFRLGRRIPSRLRMFYFFEASEKAAGKYMPSPYDGPVVLLQSQSNATGSLSAWQELVLGDLKIHNLPGDHLDAIIGPQVEVWGHRLKESLLQARISREGAT